MPVTISIWDESIPGNRRPAETLILPVAETTARDIIRNRVRQEVERHNQDLPEIFTGLVQPEESEQVLNGFRMHKKRPLDADAQVQRACASFQKNGFLLLVDGAQISELDERIELHEDSEVQFVKLFPL